MVDNLVLELVDKHLKTDQIVLTIGYDIENLTNPSIERRYKGEITIDAYGRKVPKHSHGTANIDHKTSSTKTITNEVMKLYDKIVNPILLIRRLNVTACNIVNEENEESTSIIEQIDLFTNYEEISKQKEKSLKDEIEEKKIQKALLNIKKKYGKNSILKAMNYEEGATAKDRNLEVGGHKG